MITQTILPVISDSNEVLGVIAITATAFVGNETTYTVGTFTYPMRKVSTLRADSVLMEYMAIAMDATAVRQLMHQHIPGFQYIEEHMHNDTWVTAHRQHIAPHRSQSALERLLARIEY